MFRHLQQYLDQFTDGRKGNGVSNATIYVQVGGHLRRDHVESKYKRVILLAMIRLE